MTEKRFEIIYADGTVVRGTTKRQFQNARPDGIQFVIVEHKDGSIEKRKGEDVYVYRGAKQRGSQTDDETYRALTARLPILSKLLAVPPAEIPPALELAIRAIVRDEIENGGGHD